MKKLLNIVNQGISYLVNYDSEEDTFGTITIVDGNSPEVSLGFNISSVKKFKVDGSTIYPISVLDAIKDTTSEIDGVPNNNFGKNLRDILSLFILNEGDQEVLGTLTTQSLVVGSTTLDESKLEEINNFDPSSYKGDLGPKGDKGDTYTITQADYQAIANLVEVPIDPTIAAKVEKLMKKNFPVTLSFSSNWDLKEYTGATQNITLSWTITEDGVATTPTALSIKKDSTEISNTLSATGSVSSTVSSLGTTTFTISATADGSNVSGSKSVELVRAMYFGFTTGTNLTDATTLTKQAIKSSPAGTYTMSHTEVKYMWLCIGSNKKINKVTSSGFDVPMEAAVTVGDYKCYRSSNTMAPGSITFTIS